MARRLVYDPSNDYYQRLGVAPSATAEDIQHAYRQQAKRLHPDRNPTRHAWATEQFQRLNEAYGVLSDSEQRRLYDELRLGGLARGQTPSAGGMNWWDVPHPRQENASPKPPPAPRPPTPPFYAPKSMTDMGRWLESYGLGFARPAYIALMLWLNGPYKRVIQVLLVLLLVNLMLIALLVTNDLPPERQPVATPFILPSPTPSATPNFRSP